MTDISLPQTNQLAITVFFYCVLWKRWNTTLIGQSTPISSLLHFFHQYAMKKVEYHADWSGRSRVQFCRPRYNATIDLLHGSVWNMTSYFIRCVLFWQAEGEWKYRQRWHESSYFTMTSVINCYYILKHSTERPLPIFLMNGSKDYMTDLMCVV